MKIKEYLSNLIDSKKKRVDELRAAIQKSEKVEEVRALGAELDTVLAEQRDAEQQLADLDKDPTASQNGEARGFNPLASYSMEKKPEERQAVTDMYDTPEYREAFFRYVTRNEPIPAEFRANATTTTSNTGAVIPTTLMNEIIRQLSVYGEIYSRVRKLNVQGGVQFPISSLVPTATWITADTGTSESDDQALQANTSVTFNYYGLECKIAQSLLVNVTTINEFQNLFPTYATQACVRAMEIAIVKGTGSGQFLGITKDTRVPTANKITLAAADFKTWEGWKKKVFAKMKKAYRHGIFIMAQGTFDGYIDGMVDSVGQPIGRVNYGITGGETYRFGGKDVLTVEDDVISPYDTASTNDVVAIFIDLNQYAINSNLTMQVVNWTDQDTNTIKTKAILIADGKLLDPNGVLLIQKGA